MRASSRRPPLARAVLVLAGVCALGAPASAQELLAASREFPGLPDALAIGPRVRLRRACCFPLQLIVSGPHRAESAAELVV